MVNESHLRLLTEGGTAWNEWRSENPAIVPDLSNANLEHLKLDFRANLSGVDFTNANLSNSRLDGAILNKATLVKANLSHASLNKAILENADLTGANLTSTRFHRAYLDSAQFRNATLVKTQLDVISCKSADFTGAYLEDVLYETDPTVSEMFGQSILALAEAEGLCHLNPQSTAFIERFVPDVFEFIRKVSEKRKVECTITPISATMDQLAIPATMTAEAWNLEPSWLDEILCRLTILRQAYNRVGDSIPEIEIKQANSAVLAYLEKHPRDLDRIPWRTFEEIIAEILSSFGWSVTLTQPSKDNGYDILGIYRDVSGVTHSWIVECKRWHSANKVGIEIARSLYTVKNEMRVGGAILATTSDFTEGVRDFKASRYDFELKNYGAIIEWIVQYNKSSRSPGGIILP